jgi:hypothetical protein
METENGVQAPSGVRILRKGYYSQTKSNEISIIYQTYSEDAAEGKRDVAKSTFRASQRSPVSPSYRKDS